LISAQPILPNLKTAGNNLGVKNMKPSHLQACLVRIIAAIFATLCLSPAALQAQQQLSIVKAIYAGGDVQRDVTATVSGKIQGGQVSINVGNQAFGGDPAFGKSKTLTVVYQTAAGEFTVTAKEGEKLTLPNQNAILIAPAGPAADPSKSQPAQVSASQPASPAAPVLAVELPTSFQDVKTTDGRELKNVSITKVEPDGITVMTDDGVEKLPFAILPPDIQKTFSYDPQKAAAYAAADAKAQTAMFEQNERILQQQVSAANAAAAASQKADAAKAKAAQAKPMQIEIIQVISGGVLADPLEENAPIGNDVGDGGAVSPGGYSRSGKTIFVQGVSGAAEGNQMAVRAYQDGTFTYTDTQNASRTVEKWVVVGK
jgi:hypothetical protein